MKNQEKRSQEPQNRAAAEQDGKNTAQLQSAPDAENIVQGKFSSAPQAPEAENIAQGKFQKPNDEAEGKVTDPSKPVTQLYPRKEIEE